MRRLLRAGAAWHRSRLLLHRQGLALEEQRIISGSVTEIAPQVSGRVIEVPVKAYQKVEPGDTLFKIDSRPYQYRVDQLTAQLVETEAYVAQLKETYDATRAQTNATQTQLVLSELRLGRCHR